MKIAVLGAGTAGHMAVAHLARYLPNASVTHCFDPATPPIGVGEGTTPVFVEWASRVLGWDFAHLERHCDATPKAGIEFEGWGAGGGRYTHFFGSSEGQACHLSASLLGERLRTASDADVLSTRIDAVASDGRIARVAAGGREHVFDFVFDARGFPGPLTVPAVELNAVTTDAALLTRGPPRTPRDRTRAVARRHGWIFVIPLGSETAYGYVHSHSEQAAARADFERFLAEEEVREHRDVRALRFPSFRRAETSDGVVFAIGNRASFIEPLEATALGMIVLQLELATFWLLDRALGRRDASIDSLNRAIATTTDELATFVGWHYACGSVHKTPFWHRAAERFETWLAGQVADQQDRFAAYVRRGLGLPSALAYAGSIAEVDELTDVDDARLDTFGGFLDVSFAKVGHGIGWGHGA